MSVMLRKFRLSYNEIIKRQIFELRHSPSSGTKTNERK